MNGEIGNELFQSLKTKVPEKFRQITIDEWSPTPFMTDVNLFGREDDIMRWLRITLGVQSSPMHGIKGSWRRSFVTIKCHSWFGFKTKEMLDKFLLDFPTNHTYSCKATTETIKQ